VSEEFAASIFTVASQKQGEDEGSKILRNVDNYSTIFMVTYPRQPESHFLFDF
jgi:hypothetical protein